MKKMIFACAAAACLLAPVQAMAQSKPAPTVEIKAAQSNEWTGRQILAVAGGAIVGAIVVDALLPGIMMKTAIGMIGGGTLGYYWYTNEVPPMMKQTSATDGIATVVLANM